MPESKLNILVVTQYFWPENMRINDLVRDFTEKGHSVTVLTGVPNYPEGKVFETYKCAPHEFANYHGASIVRVPMIPRGKRSIQLILNYLSFFTSASTVGTYALRGRAFDAVFVYAVSPIMAAIPALVIGRLKKAPVFIWVLDLWPETLRAVGVLKKPALLALVGRMVSWIYNRADYLLLQSNGFLENVKSYCTRSMDPQRLVYFPSWAEDDFSTAADTSTAILARDESVFTVVFAGNLGEAQDFPAVLDAAEQLRGKVAVRWAIVGDGRMSEWLGQQVRARGLDNVLLLGRHPLEAMPALFANADALLVSLKTNDVFEKTIPGKVQAYLASGRPLLGMINGEAARVINESGAGFTCASGDAEGLARITQALADMAPLQLKVMGESGRNYYLQQYSKQRLLARLEDIFRNATLRKVDR
ncbi:MULTISPECIES: glycosyltransferase family 4 protein [Pseudomonas]|uniref:glycosyltransferase family 4 protein n=1 Tax=Pseudomonas TaxID=286 RepID=UPI001BEB71CA|nr:MULTISPECIES: glycosyltransferase family 4 protein [Pseudomonas]MBT2342232.1 glycosyltransferase family 4 protein [Pseudomonas fluorescens]MCD4529007.1 glycosyltransferase family 4 protein [Pseudomonas sp. C3-2018]